MTGPQLNDWNDTSSGSIKFFKPKEGNNSLRIVSSKFATTYTHWVKTAGSAKLSKATCVGKDKCPVCKAGIDLIVRNVFFILDRADGEIKLYEAPKDVFQQLKAFATHPDYGDLSNYDVNVQRSGSGLLTKYQVVASRKNNALSDEELEKVESTVNFETLNKLYPPKTVEQLQDMVDNLDPDFIVETEEKRRKRAEASGKEYTPILKPARQTTPPPKAAKATHVQDEAEFFGNSPTAEVEDLDELQW